MKNLLIATIIICLIPIISWSQGAFSTIGSTWKYEFHTYNCDHHYVVYRVESELTIGGKDCHVINTYDSYQGGPYRKYQDSLVVFEDYPEVYFVHQDSFYLLYNFEMQVGDTMEYFIPQSSPVFTRLLDTLTDRPSRINLYVADIDTLMENGNQHIVYDTYYAGLGHSEYILGRIYKGFGSSAESIVGQLGYFVAEGCGGYLICFDGDSIDIGSAGACDLVLNTVDQPVAGDIKVYPNPTTYELNVDYNDHLLFYRIFNLEGIQVLSGYGQNDVIQVNALNSGVYMIMLNFEEGIVIKKFIKI